jgi:Reverse transcriptase (RNA-dependent DNA polymerase)/Retrotransposon gag protein/Integrase core domain/Chromo (CHRromatin Organisation MOdifier) domain/GAG-pre-integrase domain
MAETIDDNLYIEDEIQDDTILNQRKEEDTRDNLKRKVDLLEEKLDTLIRELLPKRSNNFSISQNTLENIQQPNLSSRRSSISNSSNDNEITKELIKLIPRYDGSGGVQKLLEFIDNFEDYIKSVDIDTQAELTLATAKLTGDAKMWWRDHSSTVSFNSPTRVRDWNMLKKELMNTFAPAENADKIRDKLRNIKQKGSIAQYNATFRNLSIQLSDLSFAEAKYEYLKGLNPKIRDLVCTQEDNLTDIRKLQLACLRLDTHERHITIDEALITDLSSHSKVSNSKSSQKNYSRKYNQENKNRRSVDMSKITCYICDKTGDHFTSRCPKLNEMKEAYKQNLANAASDLTIIDSGATQHMFNQIETFGTISPNNSSIICANSEKLHSEYIGTVDIKMGEEDIKTLQNVLYVPKLQHNLISVRALTKEGNDILFKRDGTVKLVNDNETYEIGQAIGNIYQLKMKNNHLATIASKDIKNETLLWHHHLGHPGQKTLLSLSNHVTGLENAKLISSNEVCNGCIYAKSQRLPFGTATNRAKEILERVHTDICGPMPIPSLKGSKYILTFIDDWTRYVMVYFLINKSDTFECFLKYKAFAEKQTGKLIKIMRSDGGGEYINSIMQNYFTDNGISYEMTTAYTPQQNGVAERYNRTLLECIRAIMHSANIPKELWAEIADTAVYLRNRISTRSNISYQTPFELWRKHKPNITHLRVIWADAYMHIIKSKRSKLDKRAVKLKLIGYCDTKKAYKLWNPTTKSILTSRDVIFDEVIVLNSLTEISNTITDDEYLIESIIDERDTNGEKQYLVKWFGYSDIDNTWEPYSNIAETEAYQIWINKQQALHVNRVSELADTVSFEDVTCLSGVVDPLTLNTLHSGNISYDNSNSKPADSSNRGKVGISDSLSLETIHLYNTQQTVNNKSNDLLTSTSHTNNESNLAKSLISNRIDFEADPLTYEEALSSPEAAYWRNAIDSELESLQSNKTWSIIARPNCRSLVGCMWIFKRKYNPDGSIARYKARLVAKGYTQRYGIDYEETYAPVAKSTSIRVVLSIGAVLNLEIHQMDVKTAFLNGDLDEEIYMTIPQGIKVSSPELVCKLNRTLYGLKQSSRMWNKKIDDYLTISQGFTKLNADYSIYIRRKDTTLAIIALYVDDLILLTDTIITMNTLKLELNKAFDMTDCGEINYFLGLHISRDRSNHLITLDQSHFVTQILSRFNMIDCNPVLTPLDNSIHLKHTTNGGDNNYKPIDKTLYRQIIGSLMFLMTTTRPDIAIAISILSKFSEDPNDSHLQAAKRILRYLKGTRNYKLYLGKNTEITLKGYSDANYANDIDTRKSTTGYLFYFCGGVISWSSKRQPTVALSTTEAEYMALTHTAREAIWLRTLLHELGYSQTIATTIYEDNQSCIKLAKNPVHHAETKHIDVRHHFIREKIISNEIELIYMSTENMYADALTKALPAPRFRKLVSNMELYD